MPFVLFSPARSLRVSVMVIAFSAIALAEAAPVNDNWLGSLRVFGLSGATNGSNVEASAETFEPAVNAGGRSVWYRWVAPVSGSATAEVVTTEFTPALAVFSEPPQGASSLSSIRVLGSSETPARFVWNVEPGHLYWLAIDGKDGARGAFVLNWQLTPDGRRPDLTPSIGEPLLTHSSEPIDACEIGHGCGDINTRRQLRFGTLTRNIGEVDLYLAGIPNLSFEFHPCHSHTHLLGYADYRLLSNGVPVTAGFKASFCLMDSTRHDTTARPTPRYSCSFQGMSRGWGDWYAAGLPCQWIDVTGVPPGRYTLEVEIDSGNQLPETDEGNNIAQREIYIPAVPGTHVNDTFDTATELVGIYRERQGENSAATRDPGEPIIGTGHTVWYRWIAPSNDLMSFDVVGSFFPAALGVFSGTSLSNFVEVVNVDPFPTSTPPQRVIFQATAGTAYYIVVDSALPGITGVFRLNYWVGRPPNDDFAQAQGWDAARYDGVHLNSAIATKEPGEPYHAGNAGGRSVWIPWQPNITRSYTITTAGSDFDTLLAVYTGDSLLNLEEVASNDNDGSATWSEVTVEAEAGTTYWIAIDGRDGAAGRISFDINEMSPQPQFLSARLHHQQLELELTGPSDRSYSIEASTNLVQWAPMMGVYKQGGAFKFHVPWDSSQPMRFFRARLMPEND
jgi:hypothetical protein